MNNEKGLGLSKKKKGCLKPTKEKKLLGSVCPTDELTQIFDKIIESSKLDFIFFIIFFFFRLLVVIFGFYKEYLCLYKYLVV